MRRPLLLATLALAAAIAAPAGGAEPRLAEVPEPPLDGLEEGVRRRLTEARAAAAAAGPAERPRAWGELGRLYLAHDLREPARAALAGAAALAPENAEWPYLLAVVAQRDGEPETAERHLLRTLELEPGDLPALLRLGQVRLQRGDQSGAEQAFGQALARGEPAAAALYGLGQIRRSQDRLEEAGELLARALALQPRAAGIHYQLGLVFRQLGDESRARRHFAESRRLEAFARRPVELPDPRMLAVQALAGGARVRLARCSAALGREQPGAAVADCRAALAEDPDSLEARHLLATALAAAGELEEAVVEYRRVLAAEPDNAVARYNLGSALLEAGRRQEAAIELQAAVDADPGDPDAALALARVLAGLGRCAKAVGVFDRVLELDPRDSVARRQRAGCLARLERFAEAESELRRVLLDDPAQVAAGLDLAALLARGGQAAAAAALLEPLLPAAAGTPEEALVEFQLGSIAQQLGHAEDAVRHLARATELAPDLRDAHFNLAAARLAAGAHREAAASFATAAALDPEDADARRGEALALLAAGDVATARERLETARQALPAATALTHLLVRVLATAPDPALRDGARALALARETLGADPSPANARSVGLALAAAGRFDEAAAWHRQLLEASRRGGLAAERLAELENDLAHFERREVAPPAW